MLWLASSANNGLVVPLLKLMFYHEISNIYTDGSKSEQGEGAAAVMGDIVRKVSLPIVASIMTAELHAIRLSLGIINHTPYSNYVVCSDSMSSVQSIDNYTEDNHILHRLVHQMHESILRGNHITISWVPSHVGICVE